MTPSTSANLATRRLRSVGAAFLVRRPLVVFPAGVIAVALLAASGAPRGQVVALAFGMMAMASFFGWEAVRFRRRPVSEGHLFFSLLFTAIGIAVACFLTGGVRSPLLPLIFAPTVTALAAFGARREGGFTLAVLCALLVVLAVAPPAPFPPVASPWDGWMILDAAIAAALLLGLGVAGLSGAYASAAREVEFARLELVEAADERARSVEAVGARVAHEIKNPLASIRGLVELVKDSPAAERTGPRLEVVLSEVARIEQIARDYLSFARPLTELRREEVDLGALLHRVGAALEGRARARGVAVTLDAEALPARIDPRRVQEAVFNLLANAIEACEQGGRVDARVERRNAEVSVRIEDTGKGMDVEALARVGEAFFTTREEGTGLGVALARSVAALHGGTLVFESTPARGTVATLILPDS